MKKNIAFVCLIKEENFMLQYSSIKALLAIDPGYLSIKAIPPAFKSMTAQLSVFLWKGSVRNEKLNCT